MNERKCTKCGNTKGELKRGWIMAFYCSENCERRKINMNFQEGDKCLNCGGALKFKSRKQVVEYLNSGKCYQEAQEKYPASLWHFGKCELRYLLDFIYNGPPNNDAEKLTTLV